MECKLKHLEFIQSVIARMNSNSFTIKSWVITLISALFALAASGSNTNYVLITYIIVPVFWLLDGFYLSQEKQYRELYKEVSIKKESEIDFSMIANKYDKSNNTWISCIFTKTQIPFYGITLITSLMVMYLLNK
jgi:hypothetical protein